MGELRHGRPERKNYHVRPSPYARPSSAPELSTPARNTSADRPPTPTSIFSRMRALLSPLKWNSPRKDEETGEEKPQDEQADLNAQDQFSTDDVPHDSSSPSTSMILEPEETAEKASPMNGTGNFETPNRALAEFFQEKGSEPLSEVEAASVISLVRSIKKPVSANASDLKVTESPSLQRLKQRLSTAQLTPGQHFLSSLSRTEVSQTPTMSQYRVSKLSKTPGQSSKKKVHFSSVSSAYKFTPDSKIMSSSHKPSSVPNSKLPFQNSEYKPSPRFSAQRLASATRTNHKLPHALPNSVTKGLRKSSVTAFLPEPEPTPSKSNPSFITSTPQISTHVMELPPQLAATLQDEKVPAQEASPLHIDTGKSLFDEPDTTKPQLTPTWAVPDFFDEKGGFFGSFSPSDSSSCASSSFTKTSILISPSKPLYPRFAKPEVQLDVGVSAFRFGHASGSEATSLATPAELSKSASHSESESHSVNPSPEVIDTSNSSVTLESEKPDEVQADTIEENKSEAGPF